MCQLDWASAGTDQALHLTGWALPVPEIQGLTCPPRNGIYRSAVEAFQRAVVRHRAHACHRGGVLRHRPRPGHGLCVRRVLYRWPPAGVQHRRSDAAGHRLGGLVRSGYSSVFHWLWQPAVGRDPSGRSDSWSDRWRACSPVPHRAEPGRYGCQTFPRSHLNSIRFARQAILSRGTKQDGC